MEEVITYRCQMCGKVYKAEKLVFGISPKEINCHECEGTATVIFIDPLQGKTDYEIVKPNWKQKEKLRKREASYYGRLGFSEWEIAKLFEYNEREIKEGSLILISKK